MRLRCLSVVVCLVLAACGFHLKGSAPLPFTRIYTNISPDTNFGATLRRAIVAASPDTQFVAAPADAQAQLIQLNSRQSRRDITIDARGRVEEYELNLEFSFQIIDRQGRFLLPPTTLRDTRELPYDPDAVYARESEISVVFRNMQQSMVDRVIRHLTSPEVTLAWRSVQPRPRATDPAPLPAQ